MQQFASTSKTTWGGLPALQSPNDVLLLFDKVDTASAIAPQSAIWHFGWHVTDVRKYLKTYKTRPEVKLLPLYTTDEGGYVLINSDAWIAKLKSEQVTFLEGPYPLGDTRAVMIEGPSREALELVEVK